MAYEFSKITLDLTQLLALIGLIVALTKMSGAVEKLKEVTKEMTEELKVVGKSLADTVTRVRVLEDRAEFGRRRTDHTT